MHKISMHDGNLIIISYPRIQGCSGLNLESRLHE